MEKQKFDKILGELDYSLKNNIKVLCILRGLPGSGKSTLAKNLIASLKVGVIYSTDDYFKDSHGKYMFDPQRLSHAHNWNQERTKEGMKSNTPLIIIDNTNVCIWEMEPYINMAHNYKYYLQIIEPITWWKNNVKELYRRNTHEVNIQTIKQMALRFEPWEEGDVPKLKSVYKPHFEKYEPKEFYIPEIKIDVGKFKEAQRNVKIINGEITSYSDYFGPHSFPSRSYEPSKSSNQPSACPSYKLKKSKSFDDYTNTQIEDVSLNKDETLLPSYSEWPLLNGHKETITNQHTLLTIDDQLFTMFPHIPRTEIQEMLSACSNNVEWTIDLLLTLEPSKAQATSSTPYNLPNDQNSAHSTPEEKLERVKQQNCVKDSFAHIIDKINEIKPFYPTLSPSDILIEDKKPHNQSEPWPNDIIDISTKKTTTDEFSFKAAKSHNDLLPLMPVSVPLRLDPAFLISMQAIHNIPPVPFTRASLESFCPKVDLDFSQAQSLYFRWIAAMESEPRFNQTFYYHSNNYKHFNGNDSDLFDSEKCEMHSAECSCKLNSTLRNSTANYQNPLKPKPFAELLLEEQSKHFENQYYNGDGGDWNNASSSNTNSDRPGNDSCLANSIKRKLLVKKFPTLDSALIDEIFWGHGFDLEATTTFVDSYLSPQLEQNRVDLIGDVNESIEDHVMMQSDDLLNGLDENADDNEEDEQMDLNVVEGWYNKKPILGLSLDAKTLGLINKNLVDGSDKIKDVKYSNANPGADERNAIYRSFRGEAFANHELRMECLAKALTAARSCKKPYRGGISDYYRETAMDYDRKAKAANRKAVNSILGVNNYGMCPNSLDLHGLHVAEVIPTVKRYLTWATHKIQANGSDASKFHKLMIITGRGKTKSSQHSRLNHVVRNYLNTRGYPPFEECNPGTFTLYMVYKNLPNIY